MKKIQRERFAIIKPETKEIFCGLARSYEFRKMDCLKDIALKTYVSEKKAIASFISSWWRAEELLESGGVKIVKVLETIEFLDEDDED